MAVKSRSTGAVLPLNVIPVAYLNTTWSRVLIRLRLISPPTWPSVKASARGLRTHISFPRGSNALELIPSTQCPKGDCPEFVSPEFVKRRLS